MKTPVFKPEMFLNQFTQNLRQIDLEDAAEIANTKLQQLIDASPVVYGRWDGVYRQFGESYASKHNPENTYKARLLFIEPIVKEPCKHEPLGEHLMNGKTIYHTECRHCGIELKAEWKAKGEE